MDYSEATRELTKYVDTLDELENLSELLIRLRNSSQLKSIIYDDSIKSSSNNHTDLSSSLERIEKIQEMYKEKINTNLDFIKKVEQKINDVDSSLLRNILRRKYIQKQKLGYIAAKLHKSFGHVKRLHTSAIQQYGMLPNDPQCYSMIQNVT